MQVRRWEESEVANLKVPTPPTQEQQPVNCNREGVKIMRWGKVRCQCPWCRSPRCAADATHPPEVFVTGRQRNMDVAFPSFAAAAETAWRSGRSADIWYMIYEGRWPVVLTGKRSEHRRSDALRRRASYGERSWS